MRTIREVSAGGVIVRPGGHGPEVCLIATHGGETWQLPKGLVEAGEPPEETARREVAEETGLEGEIVRRLDDVQYWYARKEAGETVRIRKTVHFYLLRYLRGSTEDHDTEVDDARWFPLVEAQRRLSFENERRVLEQAAGLIERGEVELDKSSGR